MHALDHAVVTVRDRMDAAEATYRRMGFTLSPRGHHQLGSINHLMVFEHDYLELLGFPPGRADARPEIAASPIGLDALVLTLADAEASRAALAGMGFAVNAPHLLTRPIVVDGRADEARFSTLRFAKQPIRGGRLYYCGHLTPQLVWREEWMTHANGARGIASFTIVVPDPIGEAETYARILDVLPEPLDGERVHIALGRATLELVSARAFAAQVGALAPDPRDATGAPRDAFMAMVTIATESAEAARDVLDAGGFAPQLIDGGGFAVAAARAFNTVIAFVERA